MIARFRRRRRLVFRGLPLALAALVIAPAAVAGSVRIQAVDTSGFPAIRATVVTPLGVARPQLTENGNPTVGYSAVNLGREKAIVLALDRSQSMRGKPLTAAVSAARSLVAAAGAHDHVGIVAFGQDALALNRGSSSPSDAAAALAGLTVDTRSGTALYDAVVRSASLLVGDDRPGRAIIVVTDGRDVSSSASLAEAVAAAHAARAAVYTIGISGPDFTSDALRELATQTGGSYRQAANAAQLAGVYTSLAGELSRTWQLTYDTSLRPGALLRLKATVKGTGVASTDLTLPGLGDSGSSPSSLIPKVGYSMLGTLIVATLCGLLVLLACLFFFASRRGGRLRARLEPHVGGPVVRTSAARRSASRAATRTQISDGLERVLGELRQVKRLQATIDRANLPLHAGELLAMSAGFAVFFSFITAVAGSPALVILGVFVVFGSLPIAYVSIKATSRIKQFDNQLPDLLITIAASLKAGHSFRQGIQSVVDEGADPAAKEFRRVLTETQLGKPMDDALSDLGARIGSKNLTFVVNAVTIQRQIGGALAGLFDMIAETVRQRQQFSRKVKGLTAMGRMSAYVLVGLPFFIAVIVTIMNPIYMSPLYHTATGQKLIATGLVMIVIGSAMLKKIVSFRG